MKKLTLMAVFLYDLMLAHFLGHPVHVARKLRAHIYYETYYSY